MTAIFNALRWPKVMSRSRYERLLDRVIECRDVYDRYAGDRYHHGGAKVSVTLAELGRICHAENELWADVHRRKSRKRVKQ